MWGPARWLALVVVVALASCSSTPPKKSVYYQDDGPPDRTPADLAATADAVPRVEPIHPRANRPYTALGRSYTPLTSDTTFRQRGLASWYGKQFHGNRTASGEIYDMMAMTAAHPTLPIPSYVRVTAVRSGRSVIVRVNDRGPFKDDRIIDLSYAAATKLGYASAGTGEVEIERITTTQIASGEWRRSTPSELASATNGQASAVAMSAPLPAASPPASVAPQTPRASGRWTVQLGAFAQEMNAEALAARAAALLTFLDVSDWPVAERTPRVERDQGIYRVLVGALSDRAAAQALAGELERALARPTVVLAR
jgi:rare lipoprotein A